MQKRNYIVCLGMVCLLVVLLVGQAGAVEFKANGLLFNSLSFIKPLGWDFGSYSLCQLNSTISHNKLLVDAGLSADFTNNPGTEGLFAYRIDRLSLQMELPFAKIAVGKQLLPWGVGTLWTPTNTFTPDVNPLDDSMAEAINMAIVRIPTGPATTWEGVVAQKEAKLQVGLRRQVENIALLASTDGETLTAGAHLRTPKWYGELAITVPDTSEDMGFTGVLGTSYLSANQKWMWMGEYCVTGKGVTSASHQLFNRLTYRLLPQTSVYAYALTDLVANSSDWVVGSDYFLGPMKLTVHVIGSSLSLADFDSYYLGMVRFRAAYPF